MRKKEKALVESECCVCFARYCLVVVGAGRTQP